jgi:hypothetical protein
MIELNPIDVLKERELTILPPHFASMAISETEVHAGVITWVEAKLKGRYCVIKTPTINNAGNLTSQTMLGFEDQKELTFFMLACPFLRRN